MRVVVVDPSRTVLKAVSRLLESDGHAVRTFLDGPEALDFIKSAPDVSALITSAELTAMSGVELCWETRVLSGRDRAIYIILMSSHLDQKQLINALDCGADDVIGKPPVGEELYARLRSAERLLRLQRELIRLATIDALTGVLNRRAFFEKAQQTCSRATSHDRPTAIMLDVDHFKVVNDTYGHDVGDRVLGAVGREISGEGVIAGRLGGEEFAILISGSSLEPTMEHAEVLRAKIAGLSFETAQGRMFVTCSLGVADWHPGEVVDRLLKRADAALYEAKNGGRNRVVASRSADLDDLPASHIRSECRGASERDRRPQPSPASLDQGGPRALRPGKVDEGASSLPENGIVGRPYESLAYILDDEAQIGALVCKLLGGCGFTTKSFTSPAAFLADLKISSPDLIVLDLALGQTDEVEIIRHLEEIKYRGKLLLISGHDEKMLDEITQIGERRGLAMLPPLKKPFRAADLKERVSGRAMEAARSETRDFRTDTDASGKLIVQVAEALRNNWLELWYQPKINLESLLICGAEALVRARHPVHGIITPDKLLPPAGDPAYQILTRFVIERAMADWHQFARQGLHLNLSVNAPISVIQTPAFVTLVRSVIPDDPTFPGLIVEVTEDEVIRDSELAREIATQLKLYNVGLSIDDFGSAYASLSRLNELPVIEVKIDRSFVSGCASDRLKHGLCQTVVDLAHRFGAEACAEGVETVEDLHALTEMRCDLAQGFLFSRPMPAQELASMLLAGAGRSMAALPQTPSGNSRRIA